MGLKFGFFLLLKQHKSLNIRICVQSLDDDGQFADWCSIADEHIDGNFLHCGHAGISAIKSIYTRNLQIMIGCSKLTYSIGTSSAHRSLINVTWFVDAILYQS